MSIPADQFDDVLVFKLCISCLVPCPKFRQNLEIHSIEHFLGISLSETAMKVDVIDEQLFVVIDHVKCRGFLKQITKLLCSELELLQHLGHDALFSLLNQLGKFFEIVFLSDVIILMVEGF